MKLNFDRAMFALDGTPLVDQAGNEILMKKSLANNLVNGAPAGDPMKFYYWGQQIYKDGILEVDPVDYETLKKFVQDLPTAVIWKAQVLQCFVLTPDK
jgi:hypothetical protein